MDWTEVSLLIDQAKQGDRAAFGELWRLFEPRVLAIARRLTRDEQKALDLTQEVFIHAMRKLPQLRDARCFGGWLRQITVRKAQNKRKRDLLLVVSLPSDEVPGETVCYRAPDEHCMAREQVAKLRDALQRLKPGDRAVLEAHHLHGDDLKKMAREFEAPVGTIKRRLHDARRRLKEFF